MSVEKIFVDLSNAEKILSDIYTELDTRADKNNIPVATTSAVGGVKSGGDISVSSSGNVTVNSVNGKTVGKSVPSDAKFTDTTYSNATQSASGLMSAADKAKLDGMSGGGSETLTTLYSGTLAATTSTIKLSDSISNYDDIIIDYLCSCSSLSSRNTITKCEGFIRTDRFSSDSIIRCFNAKPDKLEGTYNGVGFYEYRRDDEIIYSIHFISNTQISVRAAMIDSTYNTFDTAQLRIYGIKK